MKGEHICKNAKTACHMQKGLNSRWPLKHSHWMIDMHCWWIQDIDMSTVGYQHACLSMHTLKV
jgi:hypothetical protein